ncbi:UDP-glucose 4-epimerase [Candidatus Protochlamydia naegleriophila]|uniref:UDP-glucose 4-epimerase n=1 Tax=Candidatus Protochlamydia naegleriophila TaxID=389348 RepID=A0A0U5CNG5_9BACT|nr:UDP-glucose 4-epimerase GalE [Candidatus Protochlamydia naegleriophila]CUI16188.1 UDP-glucose 4-epimerase [Candidatus Protochlamydia naegleriophila]
MKSKTILIVGGAGYIGSHVNKMLNQAGYQTIVIDNLSRGRAETVLYGTFVQGDIADTVFLNQFFEQHSIDAVMHFAAYIDVGESVYDPAKYYQNNVANTLNLLMAMIRHQIKTFIFSSTAALFGEPLTPMINEEHPCHPLNPYGESKWMVEKILRDFETAYGLRYSCLRYFNAAGGDPEGKIKNYQARTSNLIPLILKSLKKDNGSITIYGTDYPTPDGTCIRDYIHIEDLGRAHITALEELLAGHSSSHYNLGNGKGFSVREVIQTVEKVLGKTVQTIEGERRPGDTPILLADASKAAKALNWHPQYSLEKMIEHAWKALD